MTTTDFEDMCKQTTAWCMTLPAHRKNVAKMQMVFVGNHVKFVPKFSKS